MPLRALNEGRQWMYQTFTKQPLPKLGRLITQIASHFVRLPRLRSEQIDEVVKDITASVPGIFLSWRIAVVHKDGVESSQPRDARANM